MTQSEHPNPYTAAEMESDRWQDASVVVHVESHDPDSALFFSRAWDTPASERQIPTVGYVRLDVYEAVAKRVTELEAQLEQQAVEEIGNTHRDWKTGVHRGR